MFCIYCGNKLDDDSVFCPWCGKRQDGVVMEKPSRAEASPFTEKRSQTSEETAKGEKSRSIVLLVLLIAEMVFAPVCIAYTEAKGDSYDRVDILYISFFLLTATILGYAFSSRICKFVTRKNHMNRGKAVLGEILSLLLVAVLFVVYVLYLAILCRFIDFLA